MFPGLIRHSKSLKTGRKSKLLMGSPVKEELAALMETVSCKTCSESYSCADLGLKADDLDTDGSWTCGVCKGTHVMTIKKMAITRPQSARSGEILIPFVQEYLALSACQEYVQRKALLVNCADQVNQCKSYLLHQRFSHEFFNLATDFECSFCDGNIPGADTSSCPAEAMISRPANGGSTTIAAG